MRSRRQFVLAVLAVPVIALAVSGRSVAASDGRDAAGRIVGASDALAGVSVTGPTHEPARTALVAAKAAQQSAQTDVATATTALASLTAARDALAAAIADDDTLINGLTSLRMKESGAVVAVSVRRYVDGPSFDWVDPSRELGALQAKRSQQAVLTAATSRLSTRLSSTDAQLTETRSRRVDHLVDATALDARLDNARAELAAASQRLATATAQVESARQIEFSARTGTTVNGTDMGFVALDAYWRASLAENAVSPGCHLHWSALAAVGRTESHHGGDLGPDGLRRVGSDGLAPGRILGQVLDGTHGTKAIGDTDRGLVDGDPVHDRAVGPMQFLPGTWRTRGLDGSGDGVADVDNLYDAARAAASYLCRSSSALDTAAGLAVAFKRYSGTAAYAARAMSLAFGYAVSVALVSPAA